MLLAAPKLAKKTDAPMEEVEKSDNRQLCRHGKNYCIPTRTPSENILPKPQ